MKYYATVTGNNIIGRWEELKKIKTLRAAKIAATKEYGKGYLGHVINLVECQDDEQDRLNDIIPYTKVISKTNSAWQYDGY